jgi:hypothetical protein
VSANLISERNTDDIVGENNWWAGRRASHTRPMNEVASSVTVCVCCRRFLTTGGRWCRQRINQQTNSTQSHHKKGSTTYWEREMRWSTQQFSIHSEQWNAIKRNEKSRILATTLLNGRMRSQRPLIRKWWKKEEKQKKKWKETGQAV